MPLDKGSLILLDYTAKIKDTNEIFETTRVDDVKNTADFDPSKKYEPRLLGVGDGWVLKGLDEALLESNIGEQLNIEIPPEKAFGERDPSKVRMIPLRKLGEKANEVNIGDIIEIDDRIGIIRFIGSGRVQVDFNHKYAGRTLIYSANIIKKIEDDTEKIQNLVKRRLPLEMPDLRYELKNDSLEIFLPEQTFLIEGVQIIKRGITNDLFKYLPSINEILFIEKYVKASPPSPLSSSKEDNNQKDSNEVEKSEEPESQLAKNNGKERSQNKDQNEE